MSGPEWDDYRWVEWLLFEVTLGEWGGGEVWVSVGKLWYSLWVRENGGLLILK